MMEKCNATASASSGLIAKPDMGDQLSIVGVYHAECYDKDGNLKWTDTFPNTVVTVGKNKILDEALAGSTWTTGTIYMGMMEITGSVNAADTMASHTGWAELNISASSGVRQSVTLGAASGGVKATSSASSFSITTGDTVDGCFLVIGGTSANGNTTGVLLSAGAFSGGSRAVINGDTLNISYSLTL